jgi:hypothetical protein
MILKRNFKIYNKSIAKIMKKAYLLMIIVSIIIAVGCQKDDVENQNPTDTISIDSLTASFLTVKAWDTTTITCYASGDSLIYGWECDHGNFNGRGSQIRYAAGECCVGINTITCTVSNSLGEVSEDIEIEVLTFFAP